MKEKVIANTIITYMRDAVSSEATACAKEVSHCISLIILEPIKCNGIIDDTIMIWITKAVKEIHALQKLEAIVRQKKMFRIWYEKTKLIRRARQEKGFPISALVCKNIV